MPLTFYSRSWLVIYFLNHGRLIAELLAKLSEDEMKRLQGRELHKHPAIQKLIGKQPKLRPIPISVEDLIPESNASFSESLFALCLAFMLLLKIIN